MNLRFIIFAAVAFTLLITMGFLAVYGKQKNVVRLITADGNQYDIQVELAIGTEEKRRGLMERKELKEGKGMLFVYDRPIVPTFWMKNTLIPLDMLFVDGEGVIQHIQKNAPPCPPQTPCPTYSPPQQVMYVLEVVGGYTDQINIQSGDRMILPKAMT